MWVVSSCNLAESAFICSTAFKMLSAELLADVSRFCSVLSVGLLHAIAPIKMTMYKRFFIVQILFFSEEQANRHSLKIKLLPQLIFQVILIGLLHIIREIAKEGKRRHMRG
jgi:hypothetical protein